MDKRTAEWLKQANYDLDTAEFMANGGRHFYAVFMCHLAVEKALKGLFQAKLGATAPKTHNLAYLLEQTGLRPHQGTMEFLVRLNEAQIAARYLQNMAATQAAYPKALVRTILAQAKETTAWIRQQL